MSSRSFLNIISIISLSEGCAILTWDYYATRPRNKTIRRLTDRVKSACENAHKLWPHSIDMSEAQRISRIMEATERAAFAGLGATEEITTYTSLVLGLLAEPDLDRVTEPKRREALDKVHSSVMALARYFDRDMNQWESYQKASRACDVWKRRMGAGG